MLGTLRLFAPFPVYTNELAYKFYLSFHVFMLPQPQWNKSTSFDFDAKRKTKKISILIRTSLTIFFYWDWIIKIWKQKLESRIAISLARIGRCHLIDSWYGTIESVYKFRWKISLGHGPLLLSSHHAKLTQIFLCTLIFFVVLYFVQVAMLAVTTNATKGKDIL